MPPNNPTSGAAADQLIRALGEPVARLSLVLAGNRSICSRRMAACVRVCLLVLGGRLDLCRHHSLTPDKVGGPPINFFRAAYFGAPPVVVLGCCCVCCFGPV